MEENVLLIPDVKQKMNHWIVKVTITEELATFIGYRNGTRYKRYILTDDEGNSIPAIIYGSEIAMFMKALKLHGVYNISNAVIKQQVGAHQMHGYNSHWVLQRNTLIRHLPNEQPNLDYFLDGITKFDEISDSMADVEATIG